jgi:thioredoxin-related protein
VKKKLLLLVAIVILLVGCKQEKFYLEDEHYGNGVITDIDKKELKLLEKEKQSFAVFVYLPGCSSCAEFKKVLNEFVEEKNIEVYSISITDVEGTGVEKVEYAPSLVLYNEGKVVDLLDSASDEDLPYFKEVTSLTEWLEEYIYLEK